MQRVLDGAEARLGGRIEMSQTIRESGFLQASVPEIRRPRRLTGHLWAAGL